MIHNTRTQSCLLALFTLLVGYSSLPVMAADESHAKNVVHESAGANKVIKSILDNHLFTYDDVRGPDDCKNKTVYQRTRDVLREYIAAPDEKMVLMRDYINSDRAQCNCTGAIVGTQFNNLVNNVGLKLTSIPCL